MDAPLHLRVQWPDGTVLPIVIHKNAMGRDLVKMLRFACGPKQQITLVYNEHPLSPDVPIQGHGMKDGDSIQAIVRTIPQDDRRRIESIAQVAREVAKLTDIKMDRLECHCGVLVPDESDDIGYGVTEVTVIPEKAEQMNDGPLPAFWQDTRTEEEEEEKERRLGDPMFTTLDEAGEFFGKRGRGNWSW